MIIHGESICSVVRSIDFRKHHIKYTTENGKKVLIKFVDLVRPIYMDKLWFFNQSGYRTLVLSKPSLDGLKNYIVSKEIRIDVLKTLPNRKDIIQIDEQNCIQYIKTDEKVLIVSYYRERDPKGHKEFNKDFLIHTHFLSINLVSGDIVYDQNETLTKHIFGSQKEVIEKYYSRFMVIVTYLELTDITLEIVDGFLTTNKKTNPNLKNSSRFDVIRVTSKWNTYTFNINPIDVRGHWRLQPHGEGRRLFKYIWIEPFQKGITRRRPQKELV